MHAFIVQTTFSFSLYFIVVPLPPFATPCLAPFPIFTFRFWIPLSSPYTEIYYHFETRHHTLIPPRHLLLSAFIAHSTRARVPRQL
ncbi:hypothetical protein DFJ73DRAFT_831931, partial [Zopfochytrium polystomum]